MRGNAELLYNRDVILAGQIIYDEAANKVGTEAGVELRDPGRSVVRGSRFRPTDEFCDVFRSSMDAAPGTDRRNP